MDAFADCRFNTQDKTHSLVNFKCAWMCVFVNFRYEKARGFPLFPGFHVKKLGFDQE